jgi:Zn-dependent protease
MAFIAILNHFGLFWMKKIPKIVGQNFRISEQCAEFKKNL